MFEKTLIKRLQKIFLIEKVTFDLPDKETREQNVLYIDVVQPNVTAKKGQASARVTGDIYMYAPNNKLTFGFFNKSLHKASASDTKDFFFHKMDVSGEYYGNLVERRCSFVYFFTAQYDPEAGQLNELQFA